jgi:hypothetical protein
MDEFGFGIADQEKVSDALTRFEPQNGSERLNWRERGTYPMNNSSLYTADRTTHLKVVALALIASIVVLVVMIAARTSLDTGLIEASGPAVKASRPIAVTHGDTTVIR